MREGTEDTARADREAAVWAVRLQGPAVDAGTLESFYAWRQHPGNASAFARQATVWDDALLLGSDRDLAVAVRDALARPQTQTPWFASVRVWAGAAVAAILVFAGIFSAGGFDRTIRLQTATGEQRVIRLEDGTRLSLNTDTDMRIAFTASRRALELRHGEAFLEVAHDPSRPLTVTSGGTQVTAVGTRFNVRRMAGGVRVLLAEGRVRIRDDASGGPDVVLRPGQSAWLGGSRPPQIGTVDVATETSWTAGRVTFNDTPLAAAVAEINRYAVRPIVLDARLAGDARLSGVFETGDTKAFIDAVVVAFPLRTRRDADGRTHLIAGPPPA